MCHLNKHGSNDIVTLEPPHGPRCRSRSWVPALPLMVTGASNIGTGPVCVRAMDLGQALRLWPQVLVHVTQVCMGPGMAQSLSTKKATDGEPDSGNQCGLWTQHGTQTSAQTQDALGPWAQTWSLVTVRGPDVISVLVGIADCPDRHD